MSERRLQDDVVKLARLLGWRVLHHRDSRGTEPGFPDLLLARCDRGRTEVLYAELKSERGRLTADQRWWCERLSAHIWRPSHWIDGTIARVLRDGPPAYAGTWSGSWATDDAMPWRCRYGALHAADQGCCTCPSREEEHDG